MGWMSTTDKKTSILKRPCAFNELLGERFLPLDFFPEDIISYSERKKKKGKGTSIFLFYRMPNIKQFLEFIIFLMAAKVYRIKN